MLMMVNHSFNTQPSMGKAAELPSGAAGETNKPELSWNFFGSPGDNILINCNEQRLNK